MTRQKNWEDALKETRFKMEEEMTAERLVELKDWFKRTSNRLPASLNYKECTEIIKLIDDEIEKQQPCNVCAEPKGKRCLIMNAYEVLQAGTMKYCPNCGRKL